MSTTLPNPPLPATTFEPPARTRDVDASIPGWLREPLLHFVLLGGLLFAADQFLVSRADDPHTIVFTHEIEQQIRDLFKTQRGHEPNAAELEALRQIWLDNEVLYREGLALQVDRGDDAIRERVIFKALSVVDAQVKLPEIDDKGLRAWFETHRAKYDEPARFDFQEAVLAGDASESAVRTFVDALNAGTPGDAKAGLRVFKGRPDSNLVESYGADFPKTLEESPIGVWRTVKTRDGWHAMRLESKTTPKPAVYEPLRGVILQDWKDATASEQRTAAVRALAKKYAVKYEAAAK